MQTGICTTDFTPMTADLLFRKIANYGYTAAQFSFASVLEANFVPTGAIEIPYGADSSVIEWIKQCAKENKVTLVAANGTFNMAHPEAAVRKEGIARFKGFAQAVERLGCPIISLCSGTRNRDSLWSYHPDNSTKEAWNDMLATVKESTAIAEAHGILLAVETEAANIVDSPEQARRMMDEVGSDSLKMIMDCANLFHEGTAHPKNVRPILRHAFELFGKDIILAHGKDIVESDGIQFCGTGDGIIDFLYFLQLLKEYHYEGDMMLHGIYEEEKMIAAREFFQKYQKASE